MRNGISGVHVDCGNSPYYSTKYVGPNPEDYQPLIDWGIFTEPIPGANGRRFHYAQGKTLGVCSDLEQVKLFKKLTLGKCVG